MGFGSSFGGIGKSITSTLGGIGGGVQDVLDAARGKRTFTPTPIDIPRADFEDPERDKENQRLIDERIALIQARQAPQTSGFRPGQEGLVRELQSGGPSAAEILLGRGQEESIQRGAAEAASARGNVNPALLARLQQRNAAATRQGTSSDVAVLRAREEVARREQLGQALQVGRQGDVADTQLQLQFQEFQDQRIGELMSLGFTLDQASRQAIREFQTLRVNQNIGIQQQISGLEGIQQQAGPGLVGSIAGAIGAGIASDERVKKNIQPGSKEVRKLMDAIKLEKTDSGIYKLLDELKPYTFEYKDPTIPGAGPGKFVGVMAQDVEKSPQGREMVHETPTGKKLDVLKGFSALMAASAEFHDRIKSLERKAA